MADETKKKPAAKKEKAEGAEKPAKGEGKEAKAPKAAKKGAPASEGTAPVATSEAPKGAEGAAAPAPVAAAPTAAELLADEMAGKKIVKAKGAKNIAVGVANILATFNNTLVSITDMEGQVLGCRSAGPVGSY